MSNPIYKRVLLKLSGEAMVGDQGYGIDPKVVANTAKEIKEIFDLGVEIGIVIGGGNIFRGMSSLAKNMNRVQADQMGMLATVMNSIAVQNALENVGVNAVIQSAMPMETVAEPVVIKKANQYFKEGKVVIFAAGTGNPYFTTDTAAVLRAREIDADIVIKATKVDGVYDSDPVKNPQAKKYESISYMDVLNQNLQVMDLTAISFCKENNLKIGVANLLKDGHLKDFICGKSVGSVVC